MKYTIVLSALLIATSAFAEVTVESRQFGSGTPGSVGSQVAAPVGDTGLVHTPQYLPGSPTAATIYPRVIEVNCVKLADGNAKCDGYNWLPEMGRGEYLFIKPRIVEAPRPVTVIKEVPVKKKKE